MSALNVFVGPDIAHVFTDGAFFDPKSARIEGFAGKLFPLPYYNAVVSAVGSAYISRMLEAALSSAECNDFDELAAKFGEIAQKWKADHESQSLNRWGHFRAALVGWSPRHDAPICVMIENIHSDETTPQETKSHVDPFVPGFAFDFADPVTSGIELMERQRSQQWRSTSGKMAISGIGGFVQHSIITRDKLSMSIVRRWPDKIGHKIAGPVPAAGAFMTATSSIRV